MTWRHFNALGVVVATALWALAEPLGWVHSVVLVNRLSFAALIISFVAAWRADVPTQDDDTEDSSKTGRGGAKGGRVRRPR